VRVASIVSTLVAVLLCAASWPLDAQVGQPSDRPGVALFDDPGYRGRTLMLVVDAPDLLGTGLDRQVTSLQLAAGEVWQICSERQYYGRCETVTSSEPDLRRLGWNDAIASLRRVRGGPIGGPGVPAGLELFSGTRYTGQRRAIGVADENLRESDFNDRASSLRVARGEVWEICAHAGYEDCRVVDENVPDLAAVGLNREISSVRPRDVTRDGPERRPVVARARLILYEDVSFSGRSRVFELDTPALALFDNRVSSAQVESGTWELCEEPRFGGRCVAIRQDVADLTRLRLNDRVSSVRPRD
jgi:hypothetical protein